MFKANGIKVRSSDFCGIDFVSVRKVCAVRKGVGSNLTHAVFSNVFKAIAAFFTCLCKSCNAKKQQNKMSKLRNVEKPD